MTTSLIERGDAEFLSYDSCGMLGGKGDLLLGNKGLVGDITDRARIVWGVFRDGEL